MIPARRVIRGFLPNCRAASVARSFPPLSCGVDNPAPARFPERVRHSTSAVPNLSSGQGLKATAGECRAALDLSPILPGAAVWGLRLVRFCQRRAAMLPGGMA
jgi:hypothetical protein